jgi:hypothetical protein
MSARRPRPIYRMPTDERREHLRGFTGKRVTVVVNMLRDSAPDARRTSYTGTVLAVAYTNSGTIDHVLVLAPDGRHPLALSGATVEAVEVTT